MLSLRQVEVVRAVLLSRSVSGAAEMLNVSPAAVSRMLKHTESQIGFQLFARGRDGFTPTPEAADLIEDVEEVHRRLNRIQDRLLLSVDGQRLLRIGASPGLGLSLVPKALAGMKRVDAAIELELDVLHIEEIVPRLEMGACDLALTIYDVDDPRVTTRKLSEAELICLVAEHHTFAGRKTVTLEEVARHDLVGFDRRSFQQKMIDDLFARESLTPRYKSRARLMVTACALVREGLGITLLDAFTTFGSPPQGTRVVRLERAARFPLNVVTSPRAPLSQQAHAFLEILTAMAVNERMQA